MPKIPRVVKIIFLGLAGAYLAIAVFSSQTLAVEALEFTLKAAVDKSGYTELAIPPLGTVRAKTHSTPLHFSITLNNINLDRLRTLLGDKSTGVFDQLVASFRGQVSYFIVRILMLAFFGGLAAGLLFLRRLKPALLAGVIGLAAFGILVTGTVLTYKEEAFREPEFQGVVEVAPWLLGVAEEALVAVKDLDNSLEIVAANLMLLFQSFSQLGIPERPEEILTILHLSDVHNNPVAVSLAVQIATSFKADLVIDTGDATDYGTPLESDLVGAVARSGLPWFFVPGNHDSPVVIEAIEKIENATVLQADVVYLEEFDLAIAGIADPAAQDFAMKVPTTEELLAAAVRLREIIEASPVEPTIIASHHPLIVEQFTDLPVILLHGHTHRVNIGFTGQAVIIDAGTAGGAGIRGLMSPEQIPYTMVLLHLERLPVGWRPIAADTITVNPQNASFILERKRLVPSAAPLKLEENSDE